MILDRNIDQIVTPTLRDKCSKFHEDTVVGPAVTEPGPIAVLRILFSGAQVFTWMFGDIPQISLE